MLAGYRFSPFTLSNPPMSQTRLPQTDTQFPSKVIGVVDDVRVEIEVSTHAALNCNRREGEGFPFRCRFRVSNDGPQPVRLMARRWRLCDAYHHLKELHGPCIPGQQPVIQPGASYNFQVTLRLATEWGSLSGSLHFECVGGKNHEVAFEEQLLVPRGHLQAADAQLSAGQLKA